MNNKLNGTGARPDHIEALHAAERRICARLSLAVRLIVGELNISQATVADAAGFDGDQGRVRVNRLLRRIAALPGSDAKSWLETNGNATPRGGIATYKIVATISDLADAKSIKIDDRAIAGQTSLITLMDEAIRIYELAKSMFLKTGPEWWLDPCEHGDVDAAVVLAERLIWGFALQGDVPLHRHDELQENWGRIWEAAFQSDQELAEQANMLLLEAVDRIDTIGHNPTHRRRAAIMSRHILRGYRNDPALRVDFETLANRLLAERWTIGLAFSRDGDPLPGPEERGDYVDLLLSDLNHPGILVPLVDLPPGTPDGIYIDRVGHSTVVASGQNGDHAVSTTILPRQSPRAGEPDEQVAVAMALSALDAKVAERRQAEEALELSLADPGLDTVDAELVEESVEHHQALDRFDGVSLTRPSEQLARFSILETVGKLDAGPLYAISPGPSLSLFPPEVTERQFEQWSANLQSEVDKNLLHELKLTRLMKNQALRRNHRWYVHRHIIPFEGLRDFFLGEPGHHMAFDNPLYGHRYLDRTDREAIKEKIVRMLGETVTGQRSNRGLLLAIPAEADIVTLAGLWATVTVGATNGNGQVHLMYRTADDVEENTAVLANLRGVSVSHFRAPNVLIAYLDMLWRRFPREVTDPKAVHAKIKRMKVR